jgi:hypothetical protein
MLKSNKGTKEDKMKETWCPEIAFKNTLNSILPISFFCRDNFINKNY